MQIKACGPVLATSSTSNNAVTFGCMKTSLRENNDIFYPVTEKWNKPGVVTFLDKGW